MLQVMTEEQLETLRRQISVYATICQQLVEMHKASVSQQSTLPGQLLLLLLFFLERYYSHMCCMMLVFISQGNYLNNAQSGIGH